MTTPRYAPICIFAYARLSHLKETIKSLTLNAEAQSSDLTVFVDAAKNEAAIPAVAAVREYAKTITGFASVNVVVREQNFGLAKSIITGVTDLLKTHETLIVVEDDLVVSPYFLKYMNDGLRIFASDERVASIHGYVYPLSKEADHCFFIRGADCWGWATWRRAWRHFNPDGATLLRELKTRKLTRDFDFNNSYPYTRMLKDQISGKNQSWAIRWNASCFLADKLTLYPKQSLVRNDGFDGTGEHCSPTDIFDVSFAKAPVEIEPIEIKEDPRMRTAFEGYFRASRADRPSLAYRAFRKLKREVQKVLSR